MYLENQSQKKDSMLPQCYGIRIKHILLGSNKILLGSKKTYYRDQKNYSGRGKEGRKEGRTDGRTKRRKEGRKEGSWKELRLERRKLEGTKAGSLGRKEGSRVECKESNKLEKLQLHHVARAMSTLPHE